MCRGTKFHREGGQGYREPPTLTQNWEIGLLYKLSYKWRWILKWTNIASFPMIHSELHLIFFKPHFFIVCWGQGCKNLSPLKQPSMAHHIPGIPSKACNMKGKGDVSEQIPRSRWVCRIDDMSLLAKQHCFLFKNGASIRVEFLYWPKPSLVVRSFEVLPICSDKF